jgi:mannan endo-1,6-alpha-mannosidase
VSRWDNQTCNGGLRWSVSTFLNGYDYKNSASNAGFFQLAARLARFSGNATYSDWAAKTYTWMEQVGFIDQNGAVYDGASVTNNCTSISRLQWSANTGLLLHGSAIMYNLTNGAQPWRTRLETLLNQSSVFFKDGIMIETACEQNQMCNADQAFYKGILASSLAWTAQAAPFSAATILPLLQSSAKGAAANACSSDGICSFVWTTAASGGSVSQGLGPQYSALQVIQANLVMSAKSIPVPGGNSSGSQNGGTAGSPNKTGGGALRYGAGDNVLAMGAVLLAVVLRIYG